MASPADVACALARAAQPVEAADTPPRWLLDVQVRSFRRSLAAVRLHGGALLADPPGSGKTYVALAVAAGVSREPATCLVPAALATQWKRTAEKLGVAIQLGTHEAASRGRLPHVTGLVVIDESHHFRNAAILRYGHVARWLVGHPALLLSATPIVNGIADLTNQLALTLRDDVAALHGVPSLRAAPLRPDEPAAWSAVIVAGRGADEALPARNERTIRHRMSVSLAGQLRSFDGLRLSTDPTVARLVRMVMERAAASSPSALAGALARYRLLLLHARDAHAAGRSLDRDALRRWAGELPEQLVLWPLVPDGGGWDLALEDLDAIATLAESVARNATRRRDDPKLGHLRRVLADGRRTIVFTSFRDTVAHLRRRIAGTAWCTGAVAGFGGRRAARELVLGAFGPGARDDTEPRVLVTTDVAAEGLDLHGASRVVHYDLPWTATRLDQRAGRAVRRGARHSSVEIVTFLPPEALERRFGITRSLAYKGALPARAGLGAGDPLRCWRVLIDGAAGEGPGVRGIACISANASPSGASGILAGIELVAVGGEDAGTAWTVRPASVLWIPSGGSATSDPGIVGPMLTAAAGAHAAMRPTERQIERALEALDAPGRDLLRRASGTRWYAEHPPSVGRLGRRLAAMGRRAARHRDGSRLAAVEGALAVICGGLTAGERFMIDDIASDDDESLVERLRRLPPRPSTPTFELRLVGIVIAGG